MQEAWRDPTDSSLELAAKAVQKTHDGLGVLSHVVLKPIVGPVRVAHDFGDFQTNLDRFLKKRKIFVRGPSIVSDGHFLASIAALYGLHELSVIRLAGRDDVVALVILFVMREKCAVAPSTSAGVQVMVL